MKTMTDKLALAISAWVVLAGGYVCYANPARRWQAVLGMALLAAMWLVRRAFDGGNEASTEASTEDSTEDSTEARRNITRSIAYAGLLLGVGLLDALGWHTASGEFRVRACQVLAGAFVLVIGNAMPKKAIASQRRAMRLRARGKAVMLGALAYILAWLFLPLAYADKVAPSILLLTFVVCIFPYARHSDRSVPPMS